MSHPSLKIILADDHRMVRESLLRILKDEAIDVIGTMASGEDAWRAIQELRPQVAVLDVSMPGPDGIELAGRVSAAELPTAVLILTMHKEAALVRRAMNAGARGVVLKDDAVDDLCYAIRKVAENGTFLSPSLGHAISTTGPETELSPREMLVLRRVVDGLTSKEIAEELGLSAKTVDTYRSRAAQKLGVRNGPELVREALRQGLVSGA